MNNRDIPVTVLFNDDEFSRLKDHCRVAGVKQSTQLRQLAMSWIGRRNTNDRRGRVNAEYGVPTKKLPVIGPPRSVYGGFHVRL